MKIAVYGSGYVGLVTAVCLADLKNQVTCIDIDESKISNLNKGLVPFFEPGLDELIQKNKSRLNFTIDAKSNLKSAEIIFIAVGTPQRPDGSAELKYVFQVVEDLSHNLTDNQLIVIKSTVPPGTCQAAEEIIKKNFSGKFAVLSNPEFLRQGSAIYDFMNPDRVVIGTSKESASKLLAKLYAPLKCPIVTTDLISSELIKYASNSFLATKISFINSIANLSEKVGANIDDIAKGMGLDKRIGPLFLKAGIGYGGSCFPKDVKALLNISQTNNIDFKILKAVDEVNESQRLIPLQKLEAKLTLKNANIAVLGLAFKPDTDDLREAPSLTILKSLLAKGAKIKAWDPVAEEKVREIYQEVIYCPSPYEALEDADALIIITEWPQVKNLNLTKVKNLMRNPLIIDGRNVLNKKQATKLGITYLGIGR